MGKYVENNECQDFQIGNIIMKKLFIACKLKQFHYVGIKKLIHFSEGVRESLRRLSNVTWMAEELHKVADYVLPNQSVSTQP